MSKDPAFLFYPGDFIMGTLHFTNEQVGIYIKLLCFQHQHGGSIDKETFFAFIGDNDIVRRKFKEDDDGFYNERLLSEMVRRNKKSSNLSENAKKRWENAMQKQCNCNANVMLSGNEDEDITKDIVKEHRRAFIPPTIEEVIAYCKERGNSVNAKKFVNFYEAKGWMVGKNKMKDWKACVRTWEDDKFVTKKPTEKYDPFAGLNLTQQEKVEAARRRKEALDIARRLGNEKAI